MANESHQDRIDQNRTRLEGIRYMPELDAISKQIRATADEVRLELYSQNEPNQLSVPANMLDIALAAILATMEALDAADQMSKQKEAANG